MLLKKYNKSMNNHGDLQYLCLFYHYGTFVLSI